LTERAVIDRRAVGDHHQDAAVFGAGENAAVRPEQRLAVDVFLEQALAHHQAQVLARAAPGFVGLLVNNVAQVVETARMSRLATGQPGLARLAALPRAGGEAEHFGLDPAAFQRARQNVGADRRDRDRTPAHRA
jgi:hypothetical protein